MPEARELAIVLGELDGLVAACRGPRAVARGEEEARETLLLNLTSARMGIHREDRSAGVPIYLKAVLDVILCGATTAELTNGALATVTALIKRGFLCDPYIANAQRSVEAIASAVTHARFTGGVSRSGDECVLFNILAALQELLTSSSGPLLSDAAICDILQSCFRICFADDQSLILREAAKQTLESMFVCIFKRFRELATNDDRDEQKLRRAMASLSIESMREDSDEARDCDVDETQLSTTFEDPSKYGQPCAVEAFCFISGLINPRDERNDERVITLGLELLLLDSTDLRVLARVARVAFQLFDRSRQQLKLQMEAYFQKLQTILASPPDINSYEKKEFALSTLARLWRIPGIMNEIYFNYDNELYHSNLFEDVVKRFSENAFPLHDKESMSFLGFEALLAIIAWLERDVRVHTAEDESPELALARTKAYARKKKKDIIAEATNIFNTNPKKGITFLREKGLIGSDPRAVAEWLRMNPLLDKKLIADYISDRRNNEVLKAYVCSFDFTNTRLDQALRVFLETFRLPGESGEITKVMTHFAEHWYHSNNGPFADPDAAFTLSYAVIMLNTDQYNPQVGFNQPRMTVDSFVNNLRGTNGAGNFDPKMLQEIFYSIQREEIVMPSERTGLVKEEYIWRTLLERSGTTEGCYHRMPAGWNDKELFRVAWGPVVSALSCFYDKWDDPEITKMVILGCHSCARLADLLGIPQALDSVVIMLCKASGLIPNTDEIHEAGLKRSCPTDGPHELGLALGEDSKAIAAVQTIFELMLAYGQTLHEGWTYVVDCLIQLYRARMLPAEFTVVVDYVAVTGTVSINREYPRAMKASKSESNFLTWFLFGSGADLETPTQHQRHFWEEDRYKLEDVIGLSSALPYSAITGFMSAILQVSQGIIAGLEETRLSDHPTAEDSLTFCLELSGKLLLANQYRLDELWPQIRAHLKWIFERLPARSSQLTGRAIVVLLNIIDETFEESLQNEERLSSLKWFLELPEQIFVIHSQQIAKGLAHLIRRHAVALRESAHWILITSLLETARLAPHQDMKLKQDGADRTALKNDEPE
ncbi:unnamed protein product, partial [Mesorhabditis spiculigera]